MTPAERWNPDDLIMGCGVYVRGKKVEELTEEAFVEEARRLSREQNRTLSVQEEFGARMTWRKLVAGGQLRDPGRSRS